MSAYLLLWIQKNTDIEDEKLEQLIKWWILFASLRYIGMIGLFFQYLIYNEYLCKRKFDNDILLNLLKIITVIKQYSKY